MKKAVTDVGTSKYPFTLASGSDQQSPPGLIFLMNKKNVVFFPFLMQMKTVALALSLRWSA